MATISSRSSSTASSVGYSFDTGEPVSGSPAALDRVQARQQRGDDEVREAAARRNMRPVVTPYAHQDDPAGRRNRSQRALAAAREEVSDELGVPPRMVIEPTSGMLLPRDAIVTIGEPIVIAADESGEQRVVMPPAVGFGLSDRHTAMEVERTMRENTRTHYRRSVEALDSVRQARMVEALADL
jgi:hypothetical protein